MECDTDKINAGDELEVDVKAGVVHNLTQKIDIPVTPLPDVMIKILNEGGLMAHIKKHSGFDLV